VLAATSRGFAIDDVATETLTPGSHPQAGSSSLALAAKRRTCGLEGSRDDACTYDALLQMGCKYF
jgi:hypothetical protein